MGQALNVPGGWDGLLLRFGEGTDDDTLNRVLGCYDAIGVTLDDGTTFDTAEVFFTVDDDLETVLRYRVMDPDTGEATGEEQTVRFDRIIEWEVY